ncbi:unnamed protein product, partial [Vitis vinifera]
MAVRERKTTSSQGMVRPMSGIYGRGRRRNSEKQNHVECGGKAETTDVIRLLYTSACRFLPHWAYPTLFHLLKTTGTSFSLSLYHLCLV